MLFITLSRAVGLAVWFETQRTCRLPWRPRVRFPGVYGKLTVNWDQVICRDPRDFNEGLRLI